MFNHQFNYYLENNNNLIKLYTKIRQKLLNPLEPIKLLKIKSFNLKMINTFIILFDYSIIFPENFFFPTKFLCQK